MNWDIVNGDIVNGDIVNGDIVNGDIVNGDIVNWDPDVYLRFADSRLRPGMELLARIPDRHPGVVVDLGCGTGHLTARLEERWPESRIVGVDSSPEMLESARSLATGIEWVEADLTQWEPPAPADVVYSNAVLHWIGDHPALFTRLAAWVAPGGTLAVQMPDNWRHPTHTIPSAIIDQDIWPDPARRALMRDRVGPAARYRLLLSERFEAIDTWSTTYHQVLTGDDPVLAWVEGSVLRPVLDALDDEDRADFRSRCAEAYRLAYPPEPDGTTLLPFSRLFVVASGARPG